MLQALRDGSVVKLAQSPSANVYGFSTVCYDILTEVIPFQGHPLSDYELVT